MTRLRSPNLAANIRAAFGGELIQVPLSIAVFLGLAWRMTEREFGFWVAASTTAIILGAVANLGSQELLVRDVARGSDLEGQWGVTLATQFVGAGAGLAAGQLLRLWLFPEISAVTTLLIMFTNLSFLWVVESCVRTGQAIRELRIGARARLLFGLSRLSGLLVFFLTGDQTLDVYASIAFPFALFGTVLAVIDTARLTGVRPRLRLPSMSRLREGLPFVGTAWAQDMLAAFDRPLLTSFGYVAETGFYGIADRAVRLAYLPTMAVVRATLADFFEEGDKDAATTLGLAKRMLRPAVAYGVFALAAIVGGALLLSLVIPDRFETVVPMMIALSPLPGLHAIQVLAANFLTGIDRQTMRMSIHGGAVVINVGLNLVLIPRHGWLGAAMATIVAEAALTAAFWFVSVRSTED